MPSRCWFLRSSLAPLRTTQTLTDNKGNTYSANYTENPVGYVGVGAGLRPVKGFQIGFDLGLLHTGGPSIEKVAGNGRDASRALSEDPFVGAATLPNVQLTMGWAF